MNIGEFLICVGLSFFISLAISLTLLRYSQ